jgi:hypothetical protein
VSNHCAYRHGVRAAFSWPQLDCTATPSGANLFHIYSDSSRVQHEMKLPRLSSPSGLIIAVGRSAESTHTPNWSHLVSSIDWARLRPIKRRSLLPNREFRGAVKSFTRGWHGASTRQSHSESELRLLDLERSKTAVLNSSTSPSSRRWYEQAIGELTDRYCPSRGLRSTRLS